MQIDITEIISAFPEFRVAVVVAEDIDVGAERPPELAALIAARIAACRAQWADMELSEIPGIAAWRKAYRAFGIKRTSYRSSVERLVKNVLAGRGLPAINAFVDAYNAVSLAHVMPLGADDLEKVVGDLAFRYSRLGDQFLDMAGGEARGDRSAEGRGDRLCRRGEDPLPALELATGHALAGDAADPAGGGHGAGERGRRSRAGGRRSPRPPRAFRRRRGRA